MHQLRWRGIINQTAITTTHVSVSVINGAAVGCIYAGPD